MELDTKGLMDRTVHEYREILRVALLPSGELDVERIETWSASRRVVLRAALRRAGLDQLVPGVPKAGRQRRQEVRTPTEAEVQAMRATYGALPEGERAAVYLLLQMGLRSNEVLSLPRREVERAIETGSLRLVRKGGFETSLPCRTVQPLLEELVASPAKCGRAWRTVGEVLSCGVEGTQYVRLYRLCRSLGAKVGFRGLRPHLLRHAFASSLIRKGAPLPVVQKALGHADQATTLRYVHADKSDLEKYLDEL